MKKFFMILAVMLFAALPLNACGTRGNSESGTPLQSISETHSGVSEVDQEKENLKVNGEELISALRSSPYRADIENGEYGLRDASLVGADIGAFSKTLYPVPDDGEFESVNVIRAGSSLKTLNDAIASLKNVAGKKLVRFEKGVYRFNGTVNVNGVNDIYFDGNGSEIVFVTWCKGFTLANCKNVHFNDLAVDYDPSPAVSGKVVSCDTSLKTVTIRVNDEFDLSHSLYNGGKIGFGSYVEFTEDENGDLYPNPYGNLLYNSTGDKVQNILNGLYNASEKQLTLQFTSIKNVQPGTNVSVAFTMYEYETFRIENCEKIYFEGCDVYSSAGMTYIFRTVTGVYFNRTHLRLKEGSSRLMTATADGLHTNDVCGDLHVTACIFENSHDDSVNICSFYKKITSASGRTISCDSPDSVHNFPIKAGDVLEIYDPETFEFLGSFIATSVNSAFTSYTVTLNKPVKEGLRGMIVGNVTRSPAVKITDCIFRNKRNRGILLQSRNCEVSNNAFINVVHGALSLHSVLDIFSEAIVPANVRVFNNKFINGNAGYGLDGDVSVFAYGNTGRSVSGSVKNITVSNNFFYRTSQAGISFRAAGDCRAENNLFFDICLRYSSSSHCCAVRAVTSERITAENNCAVMSSAPEGFAAVKFAENCTACTNRNNIIK